MASTPETVSGRSHVVTLVQARGCHLCESARRALQRVRAEIPFELEEVDITDDDFNCDGNTLYVTALGPNGEYLNRGSVKLGAPNYTARDTDDGVSRYQVNFGINADGSGVLTGVDAELLTTARVAIDQGLTLPAPTPYP